METVQWAKDVPENRLAQLGWKMTAGGFLKAVSVGMIPLKVITATAKEWNSHVTQLGLKGAKGAKAVKRIFAEQEQTELSAVLIGVNPNALMTVAKGYKAGVVTDADLEFLSEEHAKRGNEGAAKGPGAAAPALHQGREEFIRKFDTTIKALRIK